MVKQLKNTLLLSLFFIGLSLGTKGQNYNNLSAVDAVTGKNMTLGDMSGGKGIVLIFHNLNCPFVKMYESRILTLRKKYQSQGISFALINPETGTSGPDQAALRTHIDQSGLNMSYLIDAGQAWTKLFQVSKIPEVVLLIPENKGLSIAYRGAIDNNAQAESAVSERFLERAINQVIKGEKPSPEHVRAVGCNIRTY